MIHKLPLLLLAFLFISCSKDEEINYVNEDFTLKLEVDKNEGNIFDPFNFGITPVSDKPVTRLDFSKKFDSIVFKINNSGGSFQVLKENQINVNWSHHFYLPNVYEVKLLGYKNEEIILEDSEEVQIENQRDFLNIDWNNFSSTSNNIGYVNSMHSNDLNIYRSKQNSSPSVVLSNIWTKIDYLDPANTPIINNKDAEYLYNYIVALYSAPQHSPETENLKEIYNENFKAPINNKTPLYIWITPKNKIALIESYSENDPDQIIDTKIYAEPR